jgi:hypothetical protein
VKEDVDNNNSGDIALGNVFIPSNQSGIVVSTTLTDSTGGYVFDNLQAGNYTVVED